MSDLQISLLIIGVVVVGAVTAFNWYQQWRLRRRLENAFGDKHEDVLLREEAPRGSSARGEPHGGAQRVEPILGAAVAGDGQSAEQAPFDDGLPPVPGFDPEIDYIVALDATEPISAAGLAELHTKATASGRRFRVAGYNYGTNEWEEAARLSGGRYAHLRVALQLVNRRGSVDLGALTTFCAAAQECAERFAASARCPDIEEALSRARELDAFCADVDVAIGVNIVATEGKLSGTRIRSMAETAGFRLEPQGAFHYCDDAGQTLFTLDNHEPAPFLPEQIKNLTTGGVTLLLDVPRVAEGNAALELMLAIGSELAQGLSGALVDDNGVPLNENSVGAIQSQLKAIHARMDARGMPAGSERALRLFS